MKKFTKMTEFFALFFKVHTAQLQNYWQFNDMCTIAHTVYP
jgi:hypothetical protein